MLKVIVDTFNKEDSVGALINLRMRKIVRSHSQQTVPSNSPKSFQFLSPVKFERLACQPLIPTFSLMSNLLKTLGDNWHNEHVYRPLIEKIVPNSENKKAIALALIEIYVAEHYDFKQFRSTNTETVYDDDIDICKVRKKETEEKVAKEETNFKKLLEKFQQMEAPESATEEEKEEEEEEEEEEEVEVIRKGKGQKACKRSLKAEEQHKKMLAKGIKSSMASSQEKLRDLNEYIEQLNKKMEYFIHYQKASRYYQQTKRAAVLSYASSKDVEALVKDLDFAIDQYEMLMKRYVPKDRCAGSVPGDCTTHLLPLSAVKYTNKGEVEEARCRLFKTS